MGLGPIYPNRTWKSKIGSLLKRKYIKSNKVALNEIDKKIEIDLPWKQQKKFQKQEFFDYTPVI